MSITIDSVTLIVFSGEIINVNTQSSDILLHNNILFTGTAHDVACMYFMSMNVKQKFVTSYF